MPSWYCSVSASISCQLTAARNLFSPHKLRGHTYYHLIGLLATTGMRSGEAVRLANSDMDLAEGLITIRESKLWCPSQSAITEISTPASSNAMSVPCLTVCGEMRFFFRLAQRGSAAVTAFFNKKPYREAAERLTAIIWKDNVAGVLAKPLPQTREVVGHRGMTRSLRLFPCR
jgi:hypothetical protein